MEDEMRKIYFLILLLVCLGLVSCAPTAEPVAVESVATKVVEPEVLQESQAVEPVVTEIRVEPARGGACVVTGADVFTLEESLSQVVEDATGSMPSMVNSCFAIFNVTHGEKTNMLFVRNGWALLNLPVEIFVPWAGDKFIVGDPKTVTDIIYRNGNEVILGGKAIILEVDLVVVDSDTVVVDGGVSNYYQGDTLLKMVDWSVVSGGVFVNEVRFESSRNETDQNNQRFWTAYCGGNTYGNTHLTDAVNCALGK